MSTPTQHHIKPPPWPTSPSPPNSPQQPANSSPRSAYHLQSATQGAQRPPSATTTSQKASSSAGCRPSRTMTRTAERRARRTSTYLGLKSLAAARQGVGHRLVRLSGEVTVTILLLGGLQRCRRLHSMMRLITRLVDDLGRLGCCFLLRICDSRRLWRRVRRLRQRVLKLRRRLRELRRRVRKLRRRVPGRKRFSSPSREKTSRS